MGTYTDEPQSVARWIARKLPRLLRRHGVQAAYVFGSWARRDADAWSDLDLIVVSTSRRPFVDRFRDFQDILSAAPLGIDLLVYTPEEFSRHRQTNRFLRQVLRDARRVA
jgi:predicted nucleotidyltransferase